MISRVRFFLLRLNSIDHRFQIKTKKLEKKISRDFGKNLEFKGNNDSCERLHAVFTVKLKTV